MRWPLLCGAENLIRRYRTECFQLAEPEWTETAECGTSCPRLPGLPHGLTRYDDGWRCYRCGAQPFWPLHYCSSVHASLSKFLGKYRLSGGALERTWPFPCSYAKLVLTSPTQWYILTPLVCWQR